MENPFKKIFGGRKDASFLGVDIGSSSIKIVQLKKKKGVVVLETYGELSLGPYAKTEAGRSTILSEAETAEALTNLLKESNVTTSECGVSIPLKSSLVFVMEMPTDDPKQLAQMVPIEARKYIPVPISEVDLDWKIIPKINHATSGFDESTDSSVKEKPKDIKKTEVLVAAIHKDTVAQKKTIIENAKLNLNFLEIEIFSTIRAVAGQNILNFAVLDMGSGATKLYLVEQGVIKDSHIIARGSQDITLNISRSTGISIDEAEKQKITIGVNGQTEKDKQVSDIVSSNLEYIFNETGKVILSYQKKYNKNIDKLIVTGGGAVLNGMVDFAQSHSEMEAEVTDPFSKIETPAFLDDLLKKVGPGFAVSLGIALRGLSQSE
ncbi:type IV pilus assembly protein PilM [Patescibacteria group bacterium]|nr:type IV pilus assembly protein PilM [Patescibacteria group bacterium]